MFTQLAVLSLLAVPSLAASVQSLSQSGGCLIVSGTAASGSAVTLSSDCSTSQWVIDEGNNAAVKLYNTDFCLDGQADTAGSNVVVNTCSGSSTQTWYLTGDDRVAITGGTQCMESSGTNVVTGDCAPGITAQAWTPTFEFSTDAASSASSAASASATSAASASSAIVALSSASSAVSASASSVSSAASSEASAVSASVSSAVASASDSASSVAASLSSSAAAAVSSASSAGASAVSGASSVASTATAAIGSAASAATSGAGSVASAATSGAGSAISAATSAAAAVTSAVTGSATSDFSLNKLGWIAAGVVAGGLAVL